MKLLQVILPNGYPLLEAVEDLEDILEVGALEAIDLNLIVKILVEELILKV